MPVRWALPLLTAALAALVLAACGSSDSDGGDFVADADAICTDAGREAVTAYVGSLQEPDQGAATLAYVSGLVEVRTAELEELEQLDPPEADGGRFDEYLEARRASVERLAGGLDAAEAEDFAAFNAAQGEAEQDREEADAIGAELGFGACASVLPDAAAAEIEAVLEETATSDDAKRVCGELATIRFQDQFGGRAECVRAQAASPKAKGVEVLRLRGVDGVSAEATIELTRRDQARDTFSVNLTFEGDSWRVETISPVR